MWGVGLIPNNRVSGISVLFVVQVFGKYVMIEYLLGPLGEL